MVQGRVVMRVIITTDQFSVKDSKKVVEGMGAGVDVGCCACVRVSEGRRKRRRRREMGRRAVGGIMSGDEGDSRQGACLYE